MSKIIDDKVKNYKVTIRFKNDVVIGYTCAGYSVEDKFIALWTSEFNTVEFVAGSAIIPNTQYFINLDETKEITINPIL